MGAVDISNNSMFNNIKLFAYEKTNYFHECLVAMANHGDGTKLLTHLTGRFDSVHTF